MVGMTPQQFWLALVLGLQGLSSLLCCWTHRTQPSPFCSFFGSDRHSASAFKAERKTRTSYEGQAPGGLPLGLTWLLLSSHHFHWYSLGLR